MPTDARDKLRKATPSLPVRPVEISLIATYPNPWARRPRDEYKALVANRWSPHSATFRSVANVPNQILRKLSGRTTTPDLIQVVDVSAWTILQMPSLACPEAASARPAA